MIKNIRFGPRQPWTRRFFFPAITMFAIWAALEFTHTHAWKLGIPLVTLLAGWLCGLGGFLLVLLSPLFIYPLSYFRNASLMERSLTALTPMMAECGYHTFLAGSVFPLGKTLYYGIGPIFLVILVANLMLMGICEIFCRLRVRSRQRVRVWTPGPPIVILAGPPALWLLLLWDGGVHWFYIYQEGYKLLFW